MTVTTYIIFSITAFAIVLFLLVGMLLGVKARLIPSGPVTLLVNGDNEVEVSSGETLLSTLSINKIF
jgi:Na+-transporting NADH:ubiquinone oxidoreductase subunit F